MKEEVDRLKGIVEEVRKEVSVRSKIRTEGSSNKNRIKQVGFENNKVRNEDGRGMQAEWTKECMYINKND